MTRLEWPARARPRTFVPDRQDHRHVYDIRREDEVSQGERKRARGSLAPVLTVVATVAILIVVLVGVAGRAGLLIVLAVAAVLALPLFHYLTWGWWLSRVLRRDKDSEADED